MITIVALIKVYVLVNCGVVKNSQIKKSNKNMFWDTRCSFFSDKEDFFNDIEDF